MKCNCDDWKWGAEQLHSAFGMWFIHGGEWRGSFFKFCPWCGTKLEEGENKPTPEEMSAWYGAMFVESEKTSVDLGDDLTSIYAPLEHTPVIKGTLTGSIFLTEINEAIQNFVIYDSGIIRFTNLPDLLVLAIDGKINNTTGEIELIWSAPPGPNHLVVNYEYNKF